MQSKGLRKIRLEIEEEETERWKLSGRGEISHGASWTAERSREGQRSTGGIDRSEEEVRMEAGEEERNKHLENTRNLPSHQTLFPQLISAACSSPEHFLTS
ncbi:hypothetical protein XENOCAPTIV_003773 [Xenoophorus captivus]|uniref:Uncharacterized protein n=1 Tax=Xenoophorus captivus TaxID=1517983 RepID=A0ABV0Q7V7_9TELE